MSVPKEMHPTTSEGWDGVLGKDEVILWQGRPDTGVIIGPAQIGAAVFGLFFSGFAAFWMLMASMAGGYFWMFGLIHFFAGIGVMCGPVIYSVWRRRHSWYTLTNRRAFIATDIPFKGRELASWTIGPEMSLIYRPGRLATIYFSKMVKRTDKGTSTTQIGFERITDGDEVYRLFRDTQQARIAAKEAGNTDAEDDA